jgi:hypothetical protein
MRYDGAMPRFVVLRHELPPDSPRGSHFDLMLEDGGVLRTWACEELPQLGQSVSADRLPDHRLAYLDYEGPVSGRGEVTRVIAGEYEPIAESDDELRVRLSAETMRAVLSIQKLPGEPQRWRVSLTDG